MVKNCIYLKTDSSSFKAKLERIMRHYPISNHQIDFRHIAELQEEQDKFSPAIFVGEIEDRQIFLSFVAPKKIGMFSPLPYLNYLIMQKSPGTDMLARTGYELPQWFFRSTCTDIALSTLARDFYFILDLRDRKASGEMELWYEMVQIKSDFVRMLKMLSYYSAFPVALLLVLTDFAILPVLNSMMPIEIKSLYCLACILFFPLPFSIRFHEKFGIVINIAIVALSSLIFKIPDQYLLPEMGLVISILGGFFIMFFSLNLYTVSRMPRVIEGIFLKTMKSLE